VQENFQREVILLLTIGASLFYIVALSSFHPLDRSGFSATFPPNQVKNLAGMIGASLSATAIFYLGLVAFLLPTPIVVSAVMLTLRKPNAWKFSRLAGWMFCIIPTMYGLSQSAPKIFWRGYLLPSAGSLGSAIAGMSHHTFGSTGTKVFLATMFLCGVVLVSRKSILAPLHLIFSDALKNLWKFNRSDSAVASNESSEEPRVEITSSANLVMPELPKFKILPVEQFVPPAVVEKIEHISKPLQVVPASKNPSRPYCFPPLSIFRVGNGQTTTAANALDYETTANLLTKTFADFGITGHVEGIQPGPVVTVFEFEPDAGTKLSKMMALMDDIALALKVDSIFIYPVRGKRAVGIQVPNTQRETVLLGDILLSEKFQNSESPLTIAMGKGLSGEPICADLTSMPHLLTAGATGSGKSVAINSLLCSVIMKATPEEVRMILVDPKMLELSVYEGIPHLMMPVITEPGRASLAIKWATQEMERRYKLMQHAAVRNIAGFNQYWEKASDEQRQELTMASGEENITSLPLILVVIDELADLMMMAPKDVESSIQRLAQKARASGIHLVLATQRPSVDIITGVIKANLPCRAAFQVVSKHDSRTILDQIGAEKLLGRGDMLFQKPGAARLERIQGALVSDEEVLTLVAAAKQSGQVQYDKKVIDWIETEASRQDDGEVIQGVDASDDPKFEDAVGIASQQGAISASYLQRQLKIGYNRAARIVETMEAKGMVAGADGVKPRKWLGNSNASV